MITKRSLDLIPSYIIKILMIFIIIYLFFPVIITLTFSFDPRNFPTFPPAGFTFKWFVTFFQTRTFIEGLKWSIIIAVIASGISISVALPTSFALTRHEFLGKNILLTAFQSPLIVPGVVAGVAFLTFFRGFLNIYSAITNLLIAHTILTFPYTLRTIAAAIAGLDRTLEEAAYSLGANPLSVFRHVVLPQIIPAMVSSFVFALAISLDDVAISVFLTDPYVYTFPVTLMGYMKVTFDPSIGVASIILLFLTTIIIIIIDRLVGIDKFAAFGVQR
ncbi:MAG: ABC transporter permease [Candidatus Bathyarchaeia archaeon]